MIFLKSTDQISCSLHSKCQNGTKSLSSVVYAELTQGKTLKSHIFGGP